MTDTWEELSRCHFSLPDPSQLQLHLCSADPLAGWVLACSHLVPGRGNWVSSCTWHRDGFLFKLDNATSLLVPGF